MLVYVHGNCQAPVLAQLLKEAYPEWDVRTRPVYVQPTAEEVEWYKQSILDADWVVTQWVGPNYGVEELSFDWIHENRQYKKNVIAMPPVFFQGQMPHMFYLTKDRLDAFPRPVPTPYHNVLIPHMILQGQSDPDIAETIASPDLYPSGFVEARSQEYFVELNRRETFISARNTVGPTIGIANLIQGLYRETLIGWTFDHPTRYIMSLIAREVLSAMSGSASLVRSAGPDPLDVTRCGILPSVAAQLGLRADVADSRFLHGGHVLNISQYVTRVAGAYRSASQEHLHATLHERPEVTQFLRLFDAANDVAAASTLAPQ